MITHESGTKPAGKERTFELLRLSCKKKTSNFRCFFKGARGGRNKLRDNSSKSVLASVKRMNTLTLGKRESGSTMKKGVKERRGREFSSPSRKSRASDGSDSSLL